MYTQSESVALAQRNASGNLTFTETVKPVIANAYGLPVFFAAVGEFNGTIAGANRFIECSRQTFRHFRVSCQSCGKCGHLLYIAAGSKFQRGFGISAGSF